MINWILRVIQIEAGAVTADLEELNCRVYLGSVLYRHCNVVLELRFTTNLGGFSRNAPCASTRGTAGTTQLEHNAA
jgi:hypothetical protein